MTDAKTEASHRMRLEFIPEIYLVLYILRILSIKERLLNLQRNMYVDSLFETQAKVMSRRAIKQNDCVFACFESLQNVIRNKK